MSASTRVSATVGALLVAACGTPAATNVPPAPAASAPADAAPDEPGSGATADLSVRTVPVSLGIRRVSIGATAADIVTANGRTVYRLEGDDHDPPAVRCVDDCIVTWPPLLLDGGAPTLVGVPATDVAVLVREDGNRQVTLGGWPLYFFDGDTNPGDLRGEGLAGNWSVVTADGKPVVKKSGVPELEPAP